MDFQKQISATVDTLVIIYLTFALCVGAISCILIIIFMRKISQRAAKLPPSVISVTVTQHFSITRYYAQLLVWVGICDSGVVIFFLFRYWLHQVIGMNVGHIPFSCRTADAFGLISLTTSIWLIVFISIEQCVHILKPVKYASLFSSYNIIKYLIFTLILDGGVFLLSIFSYQYIHDAPIDNSHGNVTYCRTTSIFTVTIWTTLMIDAVLPIIIITANMILALRKYMLTKQEEEKEMMTDKMTTIRVFIIFATCYCFCVAFALLLDLNCFNRTIATSFLRHQCSTGRYYNVLVYNLYHAIGLTGAQASFIIHFLFWPPFRQEMCSCRKQKRHLKFNLDVDAEKENKSEQKGSFFRTSFSDAGSAELIENPEGSSSRLPIKRDSLIDRNSSPLLQDGEDDPTTRLRREGGLATQRAPTKAPFVPVKSPFQPSNQRAYELKQVPRRASELARLGLIKVDVDPFDLGNRFGQRRGLSSEKKETRF